MIVSETEPKMNRDGLNKTQRVTILLVGAELVGKHTFAKALLKASNFPLQIRKTLQLPIANLEESDRPQIDFIVYMVDLTNRESLKIVENSLQCFDGKDYAGKTCIVALKVKCPERRAFDLDALTNLAQQHYCEVYYGSLETETEKEVLAKQIIRVSEIACGQKHNVTPLLIESTRWSPDQCDL